MTAGELRWTPEIAHHRSVTARRGSKRLLDGGLALILLCLLAPVFLCVLLIVRFTTPGGAIHRQTRIGRNGRPFVMYKFRTMHANADDEIHRTYVRRLLSEDVAPVGGERGLYKLDADPRVTRVGRTLRRTSLDELPQLVNVLQGRMSLVGPRPALPWEAELFPAKYSARFLVRPGLTGLWQVSGRSRLTMHAGLDLDLEYVRTQSFRLDAKILLKTVVTVFRSDQAS
jgi:lipopolysaccharide/colanic/teichoic acid biosynthesis glycosyltransferase